MDISHTSFFNSIPSLLGSNSCEPVSNEGQFSKEPLNFGISLFAPVSSVKGSSTFFFLQPVLTGEVFASVFVLIIAQILLFFANRFFGLESIPKGPVISSEQTVRMSLSDLQGFLASVSSGKVQTSTDTPTPSTVQADTGELSPESPEIPLVVALAVWGDYSNKPFSPSVFLIFPIFSFPGVRGALPLLILEILTTIFVRAVVPPQTTGSQPLTDPTSNTKLQSIEFSPEDLLNQFNQFNKRSETLRLFP